jgi:hypothetical protein
VNRQKLPDYAPFFINQTLLRAADEEYAMARFAFQNQLFHCYCWSSLHCLEKYMKAAILFNYGSVKGIGHNLLQLTKLFIAVTKTALPEFVAPARVSQSVWRDEQSFDFIKRIYDLGSSEVRYGTLGYSAFFGDLMKLDQLVFFIRQRAVDLDGNGPAINENQTTTWRDFLDRNPNFLLPRDLLIDRAIKENSHPICHILFNHNYSFGAEEYPHTPITVTAAGTGSPLITAFFDAAESPNSMDHPQARAFYEWLRENVKVDKAILDEMKGALP